MTAVRVAVVASLALPGLAAAQSRARLQPIPPNRGSKPAARPNALAKSLLTPAGSTPSWQPLTNQPVFLVNGACNPLLLMDGTVMVQDCGSQDWWQLSPDLTGSYVNGTWTQLASLPASFNYSPLYHSSAVLPDGRVIIEGGEYNFFNPVWTPQGAIYDPVANSWTSMAPPDSWTTIGDAQGVVLADGKYMQANCCTTQSALLDAATLTWTPTGTGKFDVFDEEGWTLLPTNQVLTVDAYVFQYNAAGANSEIYSPWSGTWRSAGNTPVQLWDSAATCGGINVASFEVGPAVLRPDGTVFATGANACGSGHTAVYNTWKRSWTAGPDFPNGLDIADGPAALLPSGNVLVDTSPGIFNTPTSFFEFDGSHLNPVPGPPNAPVDSSYYGNMLVLPTGQILFTDFSDDVEVYTSTGTYKWDWAPIVFFAPEAVAPGGSYTAVGVLFNGFSQGATYGDDAQANSNYPIVRITNRTSGDVFYSRAHEPSSMGVGFFQGLVSVHFDVPAGQEEGLSDLVVVANGIPSNPVPVRVRHE
jgi:hypothetical protein